MFAVLDIDFQGLPPKKQEPAVRLGFVLFHPTKGIREIHA
jgi:hypothetical protein